ncbi:uncharacterized protein tasor2 isoform X2 [Thalassophryne amazonica]|uniref:uncharacterized protein tasor2 isoform X2 n=1 Tax=Thalassophryne amazonica TaxID=390379 RepID=UPI001472520C|nr:uncharacterized protein tasor2 isoform X2 [Thalassophryne amazonica]
MENRNGGSSSKGVLEPVTEGSDVFNKNILNPLQSSYLYEESKQNFTYKSAFLIRSPAVEEKYNAFRAKKREDGYSEEELKESYGFLLFDDENKANQLGETGVLAGNSTCTTLGDPSKGVYMSMYSDCLDQNRWYHGKSGCIAIIRVTKGRVKKVFENYTQNFTEPSVGFDCHVSEQLSSVSAQTSSFLAFERTQYYLYELLHTENKETAQSPSLACPFAIVSFSYTDNKGTFVEPQEIREQKKMGCHFSLWKGQLQVGTRFYHVDLRSTVGAFLPAKLSTVAKVDSAISMTGMRQLLPRAVFESCFFEEVFMDGLYCSLCELISSVIEETASFSRLLKELKKKDLGLTVPLNDGGFLMLLHSSHFMTFDDAGCTAEEVMQGIFVFPDSRLIQRDTKFGQCKSAISSEALRIIPALGYAEGEVEKTPLDQTDELSNVLVQHMQSYAALINPGIASSPSREIIIFPDQYDVPDAHKNLYTAPRWTNRSWQSFRSYVNKPDSFQLPVSVASEILAAREQDKTEDHGDDVYIDLSSPEGAPPSPVIMEREDQLTGHKSSPYVEMGDSCAEAKLDSLVLPQNIVPEDQQPGTTADDTEKLDFLKLTDTVFIEADKLSVPHTPDDIPAELIVSITSAERTTEAHDKRLGVISTISTTKDNDIQLSNLPSGDLQMVGLMTNPTTNWQRTLHKVESKGHTKATKSSVQASSLQTKDGNFTSWEHDQTQNTSGHSDLDKSTNTDWRKFPKCRRKYGKPSSKRKKAPSVLTTTQQEKKPHPRKLGVSIISTNVEASFLLKKLDLWELKPVFTTCGRVLVPHGFVDTGDVIKSSKDEQQPTNNEQCPGNMLDVTSVKEHDTIEMKQQFNAAPETTTDDAESWDGSKHPQNTAVNSENSDSRESYVGKSSVPCKPQGDHSLHTDDTDMLPFGEVQEKQTDALSPGKIVKKSDFMLSKLSVLLRGKRKTLHDISEEVTNNTKPCLKKGFGSDIETLAGNEATKSALDASESVEASVMQVDTDSAHALCLTRKDVSNEMQKAEGHDTHLPRVLSETQEQAIADNEPQLLQSPTSIFQRKCRVKMLKKQQDIPEDDIKKKWWLHFPTSVFLNETDKLKACMSEFSVREQKIAACTSTDALNLLADLALGATAEQVPQQPHPTLERKASSSLEICGLTEDHYNTEQESVLHDLLRQPAASARSNLPFESSLTRSDLIESVSKEHNYSLLPSSSLPLGVPGVASQESPLFCSPRLQYHHLKNYSDVVQLASDGLEDRNGHNNRTPESTKKHMMGKRKFQHSHAFLNKDGFIQVTRQWKENYDFNLDSKFTNDAKDKTIIRALHGPWDFTIQDSREEVQLIVHMWIGLFYSRTTARFFQVDANFRYLCSEESESLDTISGIVPSPAVSDRKTTTSTTSLSIIQDSSFSKALDLSKKDALVLNEGSTILDLSLRNDNGYINTSTPQVDGKEPTLSSATPNASVGLNERSTSHLHQAKSHECYGDLAHITNLKDMNVDTRSTCQDKSICPSQNNGYLEDSDELSFRDHGTSFPTHKWKKREQILSENVMSALGNAHIIHEPNTDSTDVRDFENPATTAINLVQKPKTESSDAIKYKEVDSNNETDNGVQADVENCKLMEQPDQADCHTLLKTSDDSTNKESVMVYSEKTLETDERSKTDSLGQPKKRKKDFTIAFDEDSFVPPVDTGSSLSTQQLPTNDHHDPNKNFITESDPHTIMDEHPYHAESGQDACGDMQLSVECTNDNASTVKHTISEKVEHATSHQEPIHFKFVKKVNIKTYKVKCKKAALSVSHENPRSLVRSSANVAQSKPRTKLSEAIACKGIDSNNEADNQLHIDLENCKVIEQTNQVGCHIVLETSDDAKIEESVMVCNEKPVETDTLLSKKGSKANSPGHLKKLKKDFIIAYEEDSFVPPLDTGNSLSKQRLLTGERHDPNKSFITESDPHTTLDQHPCQAESGKDACSDLQLSVECTDDNASTEKVKHATSHQVPIGSEFVNELNIKTYEANCNKTTLSMSHENTRSLVRSCSNSSQSEPRSESSEATACKGVDSNNEPDNGLCVNLEKGKLIETSDYSTNKESVMVCNEKPMETLSLLPKEGPKVDSLDQPKKHKKDFTIAFEEDNIVPPVDTSSSLSKQQLPASDHHDSNKKNLFTESDPYTTLNEHPCQPDSGNDAYNDLPLSMDCTNDNTSTDKHTISEKVLHAPSHREPIHNEFVSELNYIYLLKRAVGRKAALLRQENTGSSCASVSQSASSDERESPSVAAKKYIVLSSGDEDQDAKLHEVEKHSSKREQSEDHFQCSVSKKCKYEDTSTKETNAENDRTEGLEKIDNRVIIPFIGMEASENDLIYPQVPCLQDKFKEYAHNQQEIPFICETTSNECSLPTDIDSASQACHENTEELFAKMPFLDAHEDKHFCSVSEPDTRCPTPTMDEKPFEGTPYSDTYGSISSHSCHENGKNRHKDPIRSSLSGEDVMALAQKHCPTSTFDGDPHLDPDHVVRTQRVLRCLHDYLSTTTHIDTLTPKETADRNFFSDQDPDPNRKCITTSSGSSHIFDNSSKKELHDVKQGVVSASAMEHEHTLSSSSSSSLHQLKSCFKDNFKEVLQTKLQFVEAGPSVGQQYSKTKDKSQGTFIGHSCHAVSPIECLQAVTPNIDCNGCKKNSQSSLSHKLLSYSQRPVLAVKPSKSKERQANISSINNKASPATFSKNIFESVKPPPDTGSTHMPCSAENIWQKTEETLELSENDYLDLESTPPLDYNTFILGCQSSLKCTVDNSSRKRSLSFLEKMSRRCLQHDMTESSMNQETLIFSEQMKQLLKRSKRGSSCNHNRDDKSKLSCYSPLSVHISCQEDQQDLAHMDDLPMSLRHKVNVDLSKGKCLSNATEENLTLHTPQLSCRMEKPVKSIDISGITAEYASIYADMMNIISAGKALPSKNKTLQKERNHPLAGPSHQITFSEQTKMEMHDSILSLNSAVKQFSKAKHRFYIYATSEDAFFEETKAYLEAEGHVPVEPSQFFLNEISSACLLIIVRNEDIAEHIFEVPHLLELKKSPSVLFAGIDEPDDIVNLTYQELFKRGGIMMFERAALESLSFRNMEKLSEILYELNKTGKWKWMLHYRDSRQLKENARMSTEAKKKKQFTQWCQEAGILEVLPYHECDIVSRERADYLTCLVRLQIQNISSRFTVFLTDKTDDTFARCGILTMSVTSLLTVAPSEMFHF